MRHPVHTASGRLGSADPRQEGPVDLRLVPLAAAAWAAAASAAEAPAGWIRWGVALCCVSAVLCGGAAGLRRSRRGQPGQNGAVGRASVLVAVAMSLLCAAAAGTVSGLRAADVTDGPWHGLAAESARASVEVTVTEDPRQARPRAGAPDVPRAVLLTARATRVGDTTVRAPVLVVVSGAGTDAWRELLPSTGLRLRASVTQPFESRETDYAAVLRVTSDEQPVVVSEPDALHRYAGELRASLREVTDGLPADARGLLPALVIGDASRVPQDLLDAVRAVDMSHLIVVSGAHLAIVLALLIGRPSTAARAERGGLAGRLGVPLRITAVLGGGLVLAFVILCRPGPSVLRASVCGGIALIAIATGRRRSLVPALAAAALLLILYDPTLARSYGFLLSVLATGALLVIAPGWSLALQRRRVPRRLAEALAAAAAAQVVCSPVVAVFAARVSVIAIPCNLLAELAFAPALLLGWAALATAPWLPSAATGLAWLASWPARWIAGIARAGSALPGAETSWPGGWAGAALLTAVILAVLVLARPALRRPVLSAGCALLLVLVVLRPAPMAQFLSGWPPRDWWLVACDVGQGDGLVLTAGSGAALVVDTGPDPRVMDECLRELGVRHIPLLVLTHFHADHVAGLPGALRGRVVGAIAVSPVRDTPGQAEFVDRTAASAGVPVAAAAQGDRGRLGDALSWEVLWPPGDLEGYGANDSSVTLLLRAGELTVLLPGDLEPPAQGRLLSQNPGLAPVDVLKVAHHGSAYQHPELLERLSPQTALISTGEDNTYGHPAPSTIRALERSGATVLRTDLHGAVALAPSGIHVRKHH